MESTRKRIEGLDLLKAYAIFVVISLHTGLWNYDIVACSEISVLAQYAFRLLAEGVPIFLIVNGFLLFRKNEFVLNKHLSKMGKILLLLILWAVLLTFSGYYLKGGVGWIGITRVFQSILSVRLGAENVGVLWFLVYLLQTYLIFPILWKIYKSDFKLYMYIFTVVAIFAVGINTLEVIRDVMFLETDVTVMNEFIDFFARFTPFGYVWYIYYFMLGGVLWYYYDALRAKRIPLFVASAISWLLLFGFGIVMSRSLGFVYRPSGNFDTIFAQVWLIGVFVFASSLSIKGKAPSSVISEIGKNTMGMYFSHFIFIELFSNFMTRNTFVERLGFYFVVVICSFSFSFIISKIPGMKKLITI